MRTNLFTSLFLLAFALVSILAIGCSESNEGNSLANFSDDTSDNTTVDSTDDTTSKPTNIVLYRQNVDTSSFHEGGFAFSKTRTDIDNMCNSSSLKPSGYSRYMAFISMTGGNNLVDMQNSPFNVPIDAEIISTNGTSIANNWSGLFNTSSVPLKKSLFDAGVFDTSSDEWWSGSNESGNYTGMMETCDDFTNSAASSAPFVGQASAVDVNWIYHDTVSSPNCGASNRRYILCIAYD